MYCPAADEGCPPGGGPWWPECGGGGAYIMEPPGPEGAETRLLPEAPLPPTEPMLGARENCGCCCCCCWGGSGCPG